MSWCDRHGHELAGESPAITLERREYVGESKGARRNSFDLPEAGMDDSGNVWVSWQTLTGDGYVNVSKSFSANDKKIMRISNSISIQQIEQLKSKSNSDHSMQPPAFFKSLSRASFYFPGDNKRPSRTVKGNLGS